MKKRFKLFPIFILIVIFSFNSCSGEDDDSNPSSGTLTVTLTGAAAYNTHLFYFMIFSESDLVNPLGFSSFEITAGGGSGVIQDDGSDLTISGGTYFLSCFIDEDDDADPNDPAGESPDDYYINYVYVNGDTTVDLMYPTGFTIN